MNTLMQAQGTRTALVFDSPHSGTHYPSDFSYAIDKQILRRAEDTYVHELYEHVPLQGAPFLQALFPRSYIDLNRSLDDLDSELINGDWPHALAPGEKTKCGMGLIWRRIRKLGEIYNRKLSIEEVEHRIQTCWRPYYKALEELINHTHSQFGVCYHINCHSMPSQVGEDSTVVEKKERADFVLGDRDGSTCSPQFTAFAEQQLLSLGYSVALNNPYKGAELIRFKSDPGDSIHCLQIEINRSLYLNEDTFERKATFVSLKDNLRIFTHELAQYARAQVAQHLQYK